MTLSAAITAAGGCFYAQYFLFLDAGIAYGPWISIEALLAPIIGGVGTVFGPLLGALVVKTLGELTKLVAGDAPGLDLVIYGLRAGRRGRVRAARHRRPHFTAASSRCGRSRGARMADALLRVEDISKRFGGLLAVDKASFTAMPGAHHRADRAERRRQDHAVLDHLRLPAAERRPHLLRRRRHHRRAAAPAGAARHRPHLPDRAAVRRPDRAREHRGRRASVAAAPRRCAGRGGRGRARGRSRRAARPAGGGADGRRAESASSSPARLPSSRGCCCSTRCWPGSIRPRSATWCRSSAPSPSAASPS